MDFKVYTNALKAYETPDGELRVRGTTSSTIRDLHGDEMTLNALQTMARTAKQNMTIFLNHNYNVPDDLFGSVKDATIVKRFDAEAGQEVYDLDIDVNVVTEDENPLAMKTFRAIKRGVKLGLSIGARVERVQKKKDTKTGEETYVIDDVRLMEASVVGIPANQRSYLQNALKSLRSAKASDAPAEDTSVYEFDVKAVEVEGEPATERTALVAALQDLLADTVAFYLKSHGAHWNVVGEEFQSYHALFGEIYEDAQGAIDPTAELLRKLNAPALGDVREIASRADGEPVADDNDAESLAEAVYAANEMVLECIARSIDEATKLNQQGILNFLAERQDMHQKWSWQLRASLAPEESEPEPAETPEAPEAGDTEGENTMDTEKATRVTVTVTQTDDKDPKSPKPELAAEPAADLPAEDVAKADTELSADEPVEAVAEEVEVAEAQAEVAEAQPNPAHEALQALGAVIASADEYTRALIIDQVADIVFKDEEVAKPEAEAPAAEEPAAEAVAAVETEAEPVAEEAAVAAEEVVEEKNLDEITAIAKSALDAAFTAQQEVALIKSQLTELIAQKAKVESDLAKALDIVGRFMDLPSGRKTYSGASVNQGTKAPWLSPVIQRMLDSQE